MKALVKIFTGPVNWVVAKKVRQAGYVVRFVDTDQIYIEMPLDPRWGIVPSCADLDEKIGYSFTQNVIIIKRLPEEKPNEVNVLS